VENRLIVFEVGGVIDLKDNIIEVGSNTTIAGQTAPYPGITTIKGNITLKGKNIVVSHISHHLGKEVNIHHQMADALNVLGVNIVLDHVAVYWGIDETLPVRFSMDVTLYKCIIAEGLQFAGHSEGEHSKGLWIVMSTNTSVIGCLGAHNALRNPRIDGDEAFLANYVVYNWGTGWDEIGPRLSNDDQIPGCTECFRKVISARDSAKVTLVGSVALAGRDSEAEYFLDGHNGTAMAYMENNIIKDRNGNNLKMANTEGEFTGGASGPDGAITLLDSAPTWPSGMEPLPAEEALYEVLRTVGPQPGRRTSHNARIVRDVANGTGEIIDSEKEVGGYPNYAATSRPITVPEGAEARQAWLDSLENEIAVDTSIDLSRLYTMVGSQASDKLRPVSALTSSEQHDNHNSKDANTGIIIYPNPVSVQIKVELGNEFAEGTFIQLFDYTGRMVVSLESTGTENTIDMGSLPAGLYIIKVSHSAKCIVQQIVKK
jgi:hypothetical protein